MEKIQKEREKWLRAFLSGDVELLKSIETSNFVAISEYGIERATIRYTTIANKKSSGNWFKPSAQSEDVEVSYIDHGQSCLVIGKAKIVANGNTIRNSNFSELWVNLGEVWKVQSIHVSEAK